MTPLIPLQNTLNPDHRSFPGGWNAFAGSLPHAHILQSAEWGLFKQRSTGWTPEIFHLSAGGNGTAANAAALALTRRIGPFAVMYLPRGPLLDYADSGLLQTVLDGLEQTARQRRVIWLKIDPDVPIGYGAPGTPEARPDPVGENLQAALTARGWQFSESQVQYRNTLVIDLQPTEDELLKAMSQSTRYKVRYGPKHGVICRKGTRADLPLLYRLYAETGARDGFLTRPYPYYEDEWGALIDAGLAQPLIAEYEGQALAHVILFRFGSTCWYFYGASSNEHRNLMPTYLLQWEAIRWARSVGCTRYDFWGAPDAFNDTDPMWGVFRWKEGFGGVVTRTIGAWDFVPSPALHTLYTRAVPAALGILKRLRRAR
jgi:lipid II:glycine glycyltransferase (peptidoglycan interpeptide bridge formation enzyme)